MQALQGDKTASQLPAMHSSSAKASARQQLASPEEAGASPSFSNILAGLSRHKDATVPTAHNTPWLESGAVSPGQVYQSHFPLLPRSFISPAGGKQQKTR